MRIVVPTDFSACASTALHYATAFARQAKAELLLLHVLPGLGSNVLPELKDTMLQWAATELKSLIAAIDARDMTIKYQIAFGASVADVLDTFIQTHAIDLVIMGNKGATGLKRVLLGSNAINIINSCSVPVISVPYGAATGAVDNLAFVSDLKNISPALQQLLPFAQLLHTGVRIMHVPPLNDLEQMHLKPLEDELKKSTGFPNIELTIVNNEDIANTVEDYVEHHKKELLVMFTNTTSFLEQLFSKTLTREIAWQSKLPLLIINKD